MTHAIWAVRHAPVDAKGLCYGQSDVPVLVDPAVAARTVLAALDLSPVFVVASPWARARDLGAAIAGDAGAELRIEARVSEASFGRWEGRAFAELERDEPAAMARWMASWTVEGPPGGESPAELQRRVSDCLDELRTLPGPVLVVAHAGVLRALRVLTRGIDWRDAMNESVGYLVPERVGAGVLDRAASGAT